MVEIIEKFAIWIKNNWVRPAGLFGALFLTLIILLYGSINYDLFDLCKALYNTQKLNNSVTASEGMLIVFVFVIIIIFWHINRGTSKAKNGTIGIAIAIMCDKEEEEKQIKSDFIDELRKLLSKSQGKYPFDLVVLPKHIVQQINDVDSLIEARDNANCKFIISGKVFTRGSKGEPTLIIDLSRLIISHKPIDINSSQQLSKEMSYVMGKKYLIPKKTEFEELEITVKYINITTIYLIETVAQLSRDFEYAETLLVELDIKTREFNNHQSKYLPIISKVRKVLPQRQAVLYLQMAHQCYAKWFKEHNVDEIIKAKQHLDKSINLSKNIYDVYILRAICIFVISHNAKLSIRELNGWKGTKDGTWFYNIAFLYAYEGDLFSAHKYYIKALNKTTTNVDVLIQIEEFINWLLIQEPNKAQLHFCIALINYHGKKDNKVALDEFKLFIELADDRFETYKTTAQHYIEKIMTTLNE